MSGLDRYAIYVKHLCCINKREPMKIGKGNVEIDPFFAEIMEALANLDGETSKEWLETQIKLCLYGAIEHAEGTLEIAEKRLAVLRPLEEKYREILRGGTLITH